MCGNVLDYMPTYMQDKVNLIWIGSGQVNLINPPRRVVSGNNEYLSVYDIPDLEISKMHVNISILRLFNPLIYPFSSAVLSKIYIAHWQVPIFKYLKNFLFGLEQMESIKLSVTFLKV